MKTQVLLIAATLVSAPAWAAFDTADQQSATDQAMFSALDQDGDGVVDWQEARDDDAISRVFSTADQNNDGNLNEDEYELAQDYNLNAQIG